MAADTLYFLRNTRPLVPGASVTSKPCSRNQFSASSYPPALNSFDICLRVQSLDAGDAQTVRHLIQPCIRLQTWSSKDTILHSLFRGGLHITIVTRDAPYHDSSVDQFRGSIRSAYSA